VAEPVQVDARSAPEYSDGGVGIHEPVATKRGQLPDGYSMPGDDEGLTAVQSPHDLAAVVPRAVLDLIADKWSILVLSAIHHGIHRNGALTETGESLFPLIESLCMWARDHADVVPVEIPARSG